MRTSRFAFPPAIADLIDARHFIGKTSPMPSGACWEWIGPRTPDGYGVYKVKGRAFMAHRIAMYLWHGQFDKVLMVCHRCDNPGCVNPDHLFLGDAKANSDDKIAKGRAPDQAGENNGNHKLNQASVDAIRRDLDCGRTQSEIAREHGVSQTTISHISRLLTWWTQVDPEKSAG